jgi:uncharacterized membrane protein
MQEGCGRKPARRAIRTQGEADAIQRVAELSQELEKIKQDDKAPEVFALTMKVREQNEQIRRLTVQIAPARDSQEASFLLNCEYNCPTFNRHENGVLSHWHELVGER